MVDDQLVQWIKSESKNQTNLTKVLLKQGYTQKQIDDAFGRVNNTSHDASFLTWIAISLGLGLFSTILVLVGIGFIVIGNFAVVGYGILLLAALVMVYLIDRIQMSNGYSNATGVRIGLVTPWLSVVVISTIFDTLWYLKESLSYYGEEGSSGLLSIFTFEGVIPSFLVTIPFYLLSNVFIIRTIIKTREYKDLLGYLFQPLFYVLAWGISYFITHTVFIKTL